MQLLRVVFCLCVIVQTLATRIENTFQETDATKVAELGLQPEPLPAKEGDVEKEVVRAPGHLVKLLGWSARKDLEKSSDRGGRTELQDNLQLPAAVSDQPDGDGRLKRSPHKHFGGCFYCGHGGGVHHPPPLYVQPIYEKPIYVQPVYQKPIYVQPVYVKPAVYTQPVYSKPVYSQPYSSGCSTCGQGGGGSGSYSYSQSSASSSSYGYNYRRK